MSAEACASSGTSPTDRHRRASIEPGDFSPYTLRARALRRKTDDAPHRLRSRCCRRSTSRFKVECPTDFDCEPRGHLPPRRRRRRPDIDYLAKDYASFRRLMLDRMALLAPTWRERSAADLGVTLVEAAGLRRRPPQLSAGRDRDRGLSRHARRRISVRRHARLVDYRMHDGCNARTWVHIEVSNDTILERVDLTGTRTRFLTFGRPDSREQRGAAASARRISPGGSSSRSHRCPCMPRQTRSLYTWGAADCCPAEG